MKRRVASIVLFVCILNNVAYAQPEQVILIDPAAGATDVATSVVLRWQQVVDTTATYTVHLSTVADFSTISFQEAGQTDTTYSAGGLTEGAVYYWRVQAVDTLAGPFSEVRMFTTVAPATVELVTPADGATDVTASPMFVWNNFNGATSYRFQLSGVNDFVSTIVDLPALFATTYQAAGLAPATTYYWRVLADNLVPDGWSATRQFTTGSGIPNQVTLNLPTTGVIEQPLSIQLSWNTVENAGSYQMQIATDNGFSNLAVDQRGITNTVFTTPQLENGTIYFWRVRARNAFGEGPFSESRGFVTMPGGATQVAPVSPENGADGVALDPTPLVWNSVAGAATYHLQISLENTFNSTIINEPALADTAYEANGLEADTTYFWRVLASNGNSANWMTTQQFSTGLGAPAQVTLATPSNGATDLPIDFDLTWNAVEGATSYIVQVATDSNFSVIVVNQSGVNETRYGVIGLAYNTSYYWRVQAVNEVGPGLFSNTWRFSTETLVVPAAPTPFAPVNGSTDVSTFLQFAWNPVDDAVSYLLQVSSRVDFQQLVISANIIGTTFQAQGTELTFGTSYFWRIKALNVAGQGGTSVIWSFATTGSDVATETEALPTTYALQANYPNPFNPTTVIQYDLPEAGTVHLTVYDMQGREVAVLVDDAIPAGRHLVTWNAENLPDGVYIYRLEAGSFSAIRKMILMK